MVLILLLTMQWASASTDQKAILDVVRRHSHDVHTCYEYAFKKNPKLAGRVVMDWEIDDLGRVLRAELDAADSSLQDAELGQCLIRNIKAWPFPPAAHGQTAVVHFPFTFGKVSKPQRQ